MPPTGATEQVHLPHLNPSTSRYVPESQETIPQLDGPIAVPSRLRGRTSEHARIESDSDPRTTTSYRREYPGDDSDDSHNDRRSDRDCRPPERGRS